jgi:hypothetical protein
MIDVYHVVRGSLPTHPLNPSKFSERGGGSLDFAQRDRNLSITLSAMERRKAPSCLAVELAAR